MLNKANHYAKQQGNLLELDWIEHSTKVFHFFSVRQHNLKRILKAWNNDLLLAEVNFWKEHSEFDNAIDFGDLDMSEKIGFFTLPTPEYL